eukprot:COSAG02_NODE_35486_length_467_cov_1.320652_2_plen_41_part_01
MCQRGGKATNWYVATLGGQITPLKRLDNSFALLTLLHSVVF